jgi:predicted transcriptional regulator
MLQDNNEKLNGMVHILEKRPLGEAIQEILRNNTPADFRSQIDTLKNQLAGPVIEEIRKPLEEALANLQEAERKASMPIHVEIARAISMIARKNGLSVAKNRPSAKAAATTSVKPHRTTPAEMKKMILETLPVKSEDGIPGSTVARSCGVTYQTIRKHLVQLADNGSIIRQGIGKNTTWHRS